MRLSSLVGENIGDFSIQARMDIYGQIMIIDEQCCLLVILPTQRLF
jgi:hypothetical protein